MNAKIPFNIQARVKESSSSRNPIQERNKHIQGRLDKAVTERRKLAAAEQTSEDPVKKFINTRGNLVSRSIARMQNLLEK